MKKRILILFLIVILTATLLPTAYAADDSKLLALTFDDGPGAYTERLLDALAERDAKVTFFMQGYLVKGKYSDVVKRAFEEGHQIASHSYNHPKLTTLSDSEITSQMTKTRDNLNSAIGLKLNYVVRPPYGAYNKTVLSLLGAPGIYWAVDPLDWKYRNADTVYDNIVGHVSDGDIILLHDIHETSVEAAIKVIDKLTDEGYEFVTVRELFRRKGVEMKNGTMYFKCREETILPAVSAPCISCETDRNGCMVTITADDGATIYYTTDGSSPLYNGKVYKDSFEIEEDTTVRAIAAFNLNGSRSEEASEDLTATLSGVKLLMMLSEYPEYPVLARLLLTLFSIPQFM